MGITEELEFQKFIARLSLAIADRLALHFPVEAIEMLRAEIQEENFRRLLFEIKRDWLIHFGGAADENHDTLVSVLLIHLVGPLNRLNFPGKVEQHKLIHAFLATLSAVLERDAVRAHFIGLSVNLMKAA